MSLDTEQTELFEPAQQTGLRFIHTADIHLDSPLRSLALRDPALAEIVETATRSALVRIVDLCIEHEVDALLIAGDLYDGDQKSMHTAALLVNQMRRLKNHHIPVFIIRGNHDFQSTITKQLSLPDNVHVFSARGESKTIKGTSAIVHGISFNKKHIPESLLPKFSKPVSDSINIGMLHTSLNGSSKHNEYAPCSVTELDEFGYQYWALGHIHKRSEQGKNSKIVMPGIPQGRDIGETGSGTVSLVSIDESHNIKVDELVVGPAQFEYIEVDLSKCNEWNDAISAIQERLSQTRNVSEADHLIARLVLKGSTSLHFKLTRDLTLLQELVRDFCAHNGDMWIEKVVCETQSQSSSTDAQQPHAALPDLNEIIHASVLGTDTIRTLASKDLEQFISKLPSDAKKLFGESEEERQAMIDKLLHDGSADLLQSVSVGDEP